MLSALKCGGSPARIVAHIVLHELSSQRYTDGCARQPILLMNIREETEAKARQIGAENKILQLQLEEEKKRIYTLQEERKQLEYRASELMFYF